VAVANFKGGVGKTSTAAHLAMSAALDGYRVLVVDLDSQGSMTSIFGGRVADEWQTAFPLLARHYAEYLRERTGRGRAGGRRPKALDETLTEALSVSAGDLIQTTHWPNIDLIGAQLDLYWAEFQIPVWRMQGRGWKLWDALGDRLEADGVLSTTTSSSSIRRPRWVSDDQRAGGGRYPSGAAWRVLPGIRLYGAVFRHAARHVFVDRRDREHGRPRPGPAETRFEWDAVRAVLTRYDGTQQAEMAALMQAYMGGSLSPWRQDFTALIGQAGEQIAGIYEADYRDFNRETYARGRAAFDETYAGFKRLLIGAWHRDVAARAGHGTAAE
jgi:chromosome partitioning protein